MAYRKWKKISIRVLVRYKDKTSLIEWSRTVKTGLGDTVNQWKIYDSITKEQECNKRRQRKAGEKRG